MTDQKRAEDRDRANDLAKSGQVPGQERVLGESGPGVTQGGMPAGQNRRESAMMVEPGDGRGRTPGQSESVMAISSATAPKSVATVESNDNVGSETGATPGQSGTAPAKSAGPEKQRE